MLAVNPELRMRKKMIGGDSQVCALELARAHLLFTLHVLLEGVDKRARVRLSELK